ncbi:MAG: hypothetical protein DRQ40_01745 [Gammaproteobacteria bacterium]|nr:MAG: hypothetical protein DRQ40_01745 [Gammaproteobacteria bacterium]
MVGVGTTEYTVGSIMERVLQQILTPPDAQYAQVAMLTDLEVDTTTFTIGQFTIPEDESLLRQGSLLEAKQELMRVVSYDSTPGVVTVIRGEYGTVATAHAAPLFLNMNPTYTRAAIFESVADNLITLSPKLFTAANELLTSITDGVFPIGDDLAVEVLDVNPGDFTTELDLHGTIVDFHPMAGGRALILNVGSQGGSNYSLATGQMVSNSAAMGTVWLRYRRRMAKATSESDTLHDLGVDERWVRIVMFGVAADLFAGRDIPAAETQWVKSVLEAENIRVGSRMSIAGGLYQLRGMLLDDAQAEMKSEYRTRVTMMPTRAVT